MRFSHITTLITLSAGSLFALGHTAMTSLEFRYGTEGVALGETGAAFSNEPGSIYYNPANGAFYAQRERINFWSTNNKEPLLPTLALKDMFLRSFSTGAYVPNLFGDFGLSLAYSQNLLWFGTVASYDQNGISKTSDNNYELVRYFTISSNWKEYLSVGASIKPVNSRLSENSKANALVVDLGIRGQFPIHFNKYFFCTPGMGVTLQNFGQDSVKYPEEGDGDPLGKTLISGLSAEIGVPNAAWITIAQDYTTLLVPTPDGKYDEPIFNGGVQLGLTPLLQLNHGYLSDKQGERDETHFGLTVGYRHAQFMDFLNLLMRAERFDSERVSFHVLYSVSKIKGWGKYDIRNNQISRQLRAGFGMAILSPNQAKQRKQLPTDRSVHELELEN